MKILALLLLLAAPALASSSGTVENAKADARFMAEEKGLLAQNDSQGNHSMNKTGGTPVENNSNGLAKVLGAAAVGLLIFIAALVLIRGREQPLASAEDEPRKKKEPPQEDV